MGAGRKPGSPNRKTRAIAEVAAREGITPLEVMLQAMRQHYDAGRLDQAAAVAKDCAPYIHPRLSSTQLQGSVGVTLEIIEEIVTVSIADHDPGPEDGAQNGALAPCAA